jgi:hypothetical protein
VQSAKTWQVDWQVEQWDREEDRLEGYAPDRIVHVRDNALLYNGINLLLKLLIGDSGQAYSNANAYLRVGNSSTAVVAASQIDLQGASKAEVAMDGGYPSVSSNAVTFKSTFDSSTGNFAWEEVGVQNGATPGGGLATNGTVRLLNRKVQSFGTKASGSSWTITLTITIT